MTATERLRQLLDERGVEWEAWNDRITVALPDTHYLEITDGTICAVMVDCTPEQAAEATLGRGTCEVEGSIDYGEFGCWQYDLSCGCRIIWPDNEPPTFCPECGRKVEQ